MHVFQRFCQPIVDDKKDIISERINAHIFVIVLGLNVADDLPLYQPQQRRVAAPEYYAQDGKTPIYKILKKNPYGR